MEKLLGKLEKKEDSRNLMAARYVGETPPARYDFMKGRRPLPAKTFGNTRYGNCTKASQANAVMRFERIEQRRTIVIPEQEVIDEYLKMTGGQDNGWYELDALKNWRHEGFDRRNRNYKIDAFAEINVRSADEIRASLFAFKVIKICFGLPKAWSRIGPAFPWDTGSGPDYNPWSWGGHSMMADAYDEDGIWVAHTWYEEPRQVRQLVTWEAVLRYADEAYTVTDSIDEWRHRPVARLVDWDRLERDVKEVTA